MWLPRRSRSSWTSPRSLGAAVVLHVSPEVTMEGLMLDERFREFCTKSDRLIAETKLNAPD